MRDTPSHQCLHLCQVVLKSVLKVTLIKATVESVNYPYHSDISNHTRHNNHIIILYYIHCKLRYFETFNIQGKQLTHDKTSFTTLHFYCKVQII